MQIGVLIVDDEDDIRFLMRAIIEAANNGLFVRGEAHDGQEALESIDDLDPSVVVLDERMPGLTGTETAEWILERRPGQAMILCSAHLDEEVIRKAEAVGIKICVTKEKVRDLPAAVRELVSAQE